MNNIKMYIVLLVIAAVGVGAFIVTNNDGSEQNNNENSQQTTTQTENNIQNTANGSDFLGIDVATLSQPYRLTVQTMSGPSETKAVIDNDNKGNTAMTITSQEGTTKMVFVDGVTYMQNPDGTWLKFPSSSSTPVDTSQYDSAGLSQQDIEDINSNATITDKGTGSCTAGQCRIFETLDNVSGEKAVIKVHEQTKRLSDVEITDSNGETTKVSYEYDTQINIVAPENAVEFNVGDLGTIPQ